MLSGEPSHSGQNYRARTATHDRAILLFYSVPRALMRAEHLGARDALPDVGHSGDARASLMRKTKQDF